MWNSTDKISFAAVEIEIQYDALVGDFWRDLNNFLTRAHPAMAPPPASLSMHQRHRPILRYGDSMRLILALLVC